MTAPAVLTVSELCKRWKCARNTVLDLIHAGGLRAFKIGKRSYRVAIVEVERYESQGTNAATDR